MKDRGTENHIYRGERRGKTNVLYFKLCKLRYIRLFTGEYPRSFPDLFLTVLFVKNPIYLYFCGFGRFFLFLYLRMLYGRAFQAMANEVRRGHFRIAPGRRQHATLIGAYQLLNDFAASAPVSAVQSFQTAACAPICRQS